MARRRTLAQLMTKVRQNLDEAAPGFWSNANIIACINAGKDRCWSEIRKLSNGYFEVTRASTDGALTIMGEAYDASAFALAADTRDYLLPPDFAEMTTIEVITAGYEHVRFSYRKETDPQFRASLVRTAEDPAGFLYTIIGDLTLRVSPLANRALDLRITYVAIVPDLEETTDTLQLPWPMHRAVEEYAVADALMADRAPDAASWEARGNATVARFFGSDTRQSTDPEFVHGYLEGES